MSTVDPASTANEEVVAAVEASSSKDPVNEPAKAEGDFADLQDSEPVYLSAEKAEATEATPEEKGTEILLRTMWQVKQRMLKRKRARLTLLLCQEAPSSSPEAATTA